MPHLDLGREKAVLEIKALVGAAAYTRSVRKGKLADQGFKPTGIVRVE